MRTHATIATAAAVATMTLLSGCGNQPETPSETLQAWLQAAGKNDADMFCTLTEANGAVAKDSNSDFVNCKVQLETLRFDVGGAADTLADAEVAAGDSNHDGQVTISADQVTVPGNPAGLPARYVLVQVPVDGQNTWVVSPQRS